MNSDHKDHTVTNPIPHQHIINKNREAVAMRKLDAIMAHTSDGYRPEVAAVMAGYAGLNSARESARRFNRSDVLEATRLPNTKERRANRAEDLAFLLDTGQHPELAVHRVGFRNINTAADAFRNWGYLDLVKRILPPPPEQDEWETAA